MKAIGVAAVAVCVLGMLSVSSQAAPLTQPPNCAAIAFRPVLSRTSDGQQDAGLYKSRFGRIEVKTFVKGGVAQGYFVEIDGKPLGPVKGVLPSSVAECAEAKRLTPPISAEAACKGDQLTVMIEHSGNDRYVLLYVLRNGAWRFCSAGIA